MNTTELFQKAYEGSYYTITGCGGNLQEWIDGYEKIFAEKGIGKPVCWHHFTGKDMNEEYHLTGRNAYQDDLVFLCFPTDGLDIPRLSIFKILAADRWFDDIVENNRRRERELRDEI